MTTRDIEILQPKTESSEWLKQHEALMHRVSKAAIVVGYGGTINGATAEQALENAETALLDHALALQSQDAEDAERYRWLLGKFQQSYDGEDFEAYSVSIYSRMASQFKGDRTIQAEISWRDKTDEPIGLSEAIDHARRIEENE